MRKFIFSRLVQFRKQLASLQVRDRDGLRIIDHGTKTAKPLADRLPVGSVQKVDDWPSDGNGTELVRVTQDDL